MSKRSYVPPIEIRVGQNRDYQKGVDRMACKFPGCKRWRVDGKTKFCREHDKGYVMSFPMRKRYHIEFDAIQKTASAKETP